MRLPIGYDNFQKVIEKNLDYIDKTLFIKSLFDDDLTEVAVIIRPRRFGKTLNLSMLQHFLAAHVYGKDTHSLFNGLNITRCPEYLQHQGKYPVIFVTFKDVKESNYTEAQNNLAQLMSQVYSNHSELLHSEKLSKQQQTDFQLILERRAQPTLLKAALRYLTEFLYLHYGVKPWLLIDEYDTPIQYGYLHQYYDQIIEFMRGLFGMVLKTNPYLNRGVITGILRIAKESLFSGVNNLKVYSVLNEQYSEYFGFTEPEVDEILKKSQLSQQAADVRLWYNGYRFSNTTVYNPWSIVNYVSERILKPYWVNTSGNDLIKSILKNSPLKFKTEFEALMQGGSTQQLIDENMVFDDLSNHHNTAAAWSLMLMSGYLTTVMCEQQWDGTLCQLRVPNREVNDLYRTIVGSWLADPLGLMWYSQFIKALTEGHIEKFKEDLEKIVLSITSYHDFAKEPEAFFHGLLLGFIASLQETHIITSNRESGLGRYDIMLIPRNSTQLGIVIELKTASISDATSLDALAAAALQQIDRQHYITECRAHHIQHVLKIAIAFVGKSFALRYEKTEC